MLPDNDRWRIKFGQCYTFILIDGTIVDGFAHDSCVITGALYGLDRVDICWSRVSGVKGE